MDRLDSHMASCACILYRFCTATAAPLLSAHLLFRQILGKESATRLRERWGQATRSRPEGRLIWIHAVSLGEGAAALPIIQKILEELPSTSVLVTGGTLMSDEWRRQIYPESVIRQFIPLDTPSAVIRFISHWQPDVGIFVESELWPNLIDVAHTRGVKLILVSARMSSASYRLWSFPFARALWRRTVNRFSRISPKNLTQMRGFISFGANESLFTDVADLKVLSTSGRYRPTDNLGCQRIPTLLSFSLRRISELSKTFWVAASTHTEEEVACGRIHHELRKVFPTLITIIVPRHAERGVLIRDDLSHLGLNVRALSRGEMPLENTDVFLVDIVGALIDVYMAAAGKPAFIGGSLFSGRGHNVSEATLCGCSTIVGAHHETFAEFIQELNASCEEFCEVISSGNDLLRAVRSRLDDPSRTAALGSASMQRTVTLQRGVLENVWACMQLEQI